MRAPLFISERQNPAKRGRKRNVREVVRFDDPMLDEAEEAQRRG